MSSSDRIIAACCPDSPTYIDVFAHAARITAIVAGARLPNPSKSSPATAAVGGSDTDSGAVGIPGSVSGLPPTEVAA